MPRTQARVLVVACLIVGLPALAPSGASGRIPENDPPPQVAALKKQVRVLRAQVRDLQGEVSFLGGRVATLQGEVALIPQLAGIAMATGKYRDVATALADGYVKRKVPCIPRAGYHYVNAALLDNVVDPLRPEILVYGPGGGGLLKLVAVEYAVPVGFPRPTLFGVAFDNDEGGIRGEPLWVLNIWLWQLDPTGLFASENPTVEC